MPGSRERSRNGPVPLALNDAVFSMPLRLSTGCVARFSVHHFLLRIAHSEITSGRIGNGSVVTTSIAWSLILLISLIEPT